MAKWEVFVADDQSRRAVKVLHRVAKILGIEPVSAAQCKADMLVLWGWGGRQQQQAIERQFQAGGHVVSLDFGYFDRNRDSVRISIDGFHPQHLLQYADREDRQRHLARERLYNESGHVLVVGMGHKSRELLGFTSTEWERMAVNQARHVFPDAEIFYRPKTNVNERIGGTVSACDGNIRGALVGARLAIVRHSNVAVDCAVYGVPCVCVDGAGAFLWGKEISQGACSFDADRAADFIRRVSWFNWLPDEYREMITFIEYLRSKL